MFSDNIITSRQNPSVIRAQKLRDKKYRDAEGVFLADGIKLFIEAHKNGAEIRRIYLSESAKIEGEALYLVENEYKDRILTLSDSCFSKISEEKAPQGIIAEIKYLDKWKLFTTIYNREFSKSERIFLVDSIQDPGNLGTILRSAAAFGIDRVIVGGSSADISSDKTIRASMGAVFGIEIDVVRDTALALKALESAGRRVYSMELKSDSEKLSEIDISSSDVFFVGNEGKGISEELSELCTKSVFIPMTDKAESLNAAIAASVCLWAQYSVVLKSGK